MAAKRPDDSLLLRISLRTVPGKGRRVSKAKCSMLYTEKSNLTSASVLLLCHSGRPSGSDQSYPDGPSKSAERDRGNIRYVRAIRTAKDLY
jgi:hypothetical protein